MKNKLTALSFILIVLLGAYVRLTTAKTAYPAQLDAGHMVQFGIEIANGNEQYLEVLYSRFQQYTAAWAYSRGMDPGRALQWVTLFFGTMLVPASMLFVRQLFGRWNLALISGLFVATNPSLVLYSVNGMGEVPFASLLMGACALLVFGTNSGTRRVYLIPLAFGVLAVGIYYRDIEALLSALVFIVWLIWQSLKCRSIQYVAWGLVGLLVLFTIWTPHRLYTKEVNPKGGASLKMTYLVWADAARSSQTQHDPDNQAFADLEKLKEIGVYKYAWIHKQRIIKNYAASIIRMLKAFNNHIFAGPYKIGADVFILILITAALALPRPVQYDRWLLVGTLCFFFPLLACASFINPRWLVGNIAFLLIIFAAPLAFLLERLGERKWKYAIWAFAVLFSVRSASFAIDEHGDTIRYHAIRDAGIALRKYGDDNDVLVTAYPQVMIHFYEKSPGRGVLIPYAKTIERIDELIGERGGTLIALSSLDHTRSWPVNELFHCAKPPPNWELLDRIRYEWESRKYGPQEVEYLFFRRHPKKALDAVGNEPNNS